MTDANSFADLGVPSAIVEALGRSRIRAPFPIQAETIPDLLAGRDLIGRAPTGSGKTLAFGIPLVVATEQAGRARKKRPTALVLAPTRELAAQIADELHPLAAAVDRRTLAIYGGVGLEPQIRRLANGIDLLVATPGRLEDLIGQRAVSLAEVRHVVIDEADRMADMGFLPAVRRILDQTPPNRQTVLYSATLDGEVAKLTKAYQNDARRHEVGEATPDLTKMEHHFWLLDRKERIPLCASVVATFGRTIVFTRTRHGADRAARQLSNAGVKSVPIHGNRSQAQRRRALEDFVTGRAHALVATDVAARGIHVDAVECVVHFDPVDEDSAYVHRSGRTARAGARGVVVSFVDPSQQRLVKAMTQRLGLPQEITEPPATEAHLHSPSPQTGNDGDPTPRAGGTGHTKDTRSAQRPHSTQPKKKNPKKNPRKKSAKTAGQRSDDRRPDSSTRSRPHTGANGRKRSGTGKTEPTASQRRNAATDRRDGAGRSDDRDENDRPTSGRRGGNAGRTGGPRRKGASGTGSGRARAKPKPKNRSRPSQKGRRRPPGSGQGRSS